MEEPRLTVVTDSHQEPHSLTPQTEIDSAPYIGRWNKLVSTTNWEKGRIICEWRESLVQLQASPAEYADEAWSQLVGSVTPQHVGRLRRVYLRFNQVFHQYDGLHWSHFYAALDWDDAEMWLEGAVLNHWSVAQMRRMRWETLGEPQTDPPTGDETVASPVDDDFDHADRPDAIAEKVRGVVEQVAEGSAQTVMEKDSTNPSSGAAKGHQADDEGALIYTDGRIENSARFVRPFENLAELPNDLAEAFEAFKLAILRHKTDDWRQVSRDETLASLDALKELALAPSVDESPF